MHTRAFLLSILLCAVATAQAPPVAAPAPVPAGASKPVVVPPGQIAVTQLVQVVARVAKHNILCDEQQLGGAKAIGAIELTEPLTLEPLSCEDLLCGLLRTRGLALMPIDTERGIYEVVALMGPRGRELMSSAIPRTAAEILAQPESRRAVVTTVQLVNVNAPIVVNALRPMFAMAGGGGGGMEISMVGVTGIVLRGWQNEVATALKIIQETDKPRPGGVPPQPAGLPGAPAAPDVGVRIAVLEKQVEELQRKLAALQPAVSK